MAIIGFGAKSIPVRTILTLIHPIRVLMRLVLFALVYFALFLTSQGMHGIGHLIGAEWIGAKAEIHFIYITSDALSSITSLVPLTTLLHLDNILPITNFMPIASRVSLTVLPSNTDILFIFYLAGGLIAALLPWPMLWVFTRTIYHNVALEAICASLFLLHIFFATSEVISFYGDSTPHQIVLFIAVGISQVIFFVLYSRSIVRWLFAKNKPPLQ